MGVNRSLLCAGRVADCYHVPTIIEFAVIFVCIMDGDFDDGSSGYRII